MKVQELRIGNWVECFDKHVQIDGIKRGSIGTFSVEICEKRPSGCSWCELVPIDSLSLKPIPLTEEWLLKFGFTGDENIGYRILINQRYNLAISDLNNLKFECYGNDINAMLHLEHVHQLQNLFFALTGEELKVKL